MIDGVEQTPIHGLSISYSFADADAPARRTTQYFEMLGCRAIYEDGWKAVVYHEIFDQRVDWDDDVWELYNVAVDASECHDLAAEEPERLARLIERWWEEAERYRVLPLDNAPFDRCSARSAPRTRPAPGTCTTRTAAR